MREAEMAAPTVGHPTTSYDSGRIRLSGRFGLTRPRSERLGRSCATRFREAAYRRKSTASAPISDRFIRVRSALGRIPDAIDRRIVLMRFFVGLSIRQIARRLRLDREVVSKRYQASLRLLEGHLRKWL